MKYNALIIGAGQLGSRHMQGLLKLKDPINVFIVDPSLSSLEIAASRAKEIDHQHDLHFSTEWNELPNSFDLVIVATNSNVRAEIIIKLLNNYIIKYLILEKVLFQNIESYKIISDLLFKNSVKVWVNHPRRMSKEYQSLKSLLQQGSNKNFQVTGVDWGLGCNGLHFIDLFVYLTESRVKNIDAEWVDSEIKESKRNGFIEFTGSIKGILEDNSSFVITSHKGDANACTITIFDKIKRFVVFESITPRIIEFSIGKEIKETSLPLSLNFQSSLTQNLAEELLKYGTCDLPTYEEARHSHEQFISALLNKFNQITGVIHNNLPIT